jgi:hypothetical protein
VTKAYDGHEKNLKKLKEIPESSNIIFEWKNIKTIFSHAADESLGKYKLLTKKKTKVMG